MARLARAEVFSPEKIAIVHVMNRVVRRCFLLGTDPIPGQNYDHRKLWMEDLVAGKPQSVDDQRTQISQRRFNMRRARTPVDCVLANRRSAASSSHLLLCGVGGGTAAMLLPATPLDASDTVPILVSPPWARK